MGPPSHRQTREGGCPPFFHGSVPAAPFCSQTRSGSPQPLGSFFLFFSSFILLTASFFFIHIPSRLRLRHVSPPCHTSPLRHALPLITTLSHPPITTRHPFATHCLHPRRAAPRHASPLSCHALITCRPSRVGGVSHHHVATLDLGLQC